MPSILPTFEYDIFISYRHNDNRSGWVTEWVKALQEELATTIKEPVSVYFDSNPHDGLLETHNVDKSLEGKLKCLIFIPILSQTYCDPKSFAWQHEFVPFNKMAKDDQFGRDIKLSNGNVASRILPIKIHDLDAEDKATIETEIGGALRAIELIFKSLGVNRPLNPTDNPEKNQSKTFYKDEVNKVALGVKELLTALKHFDSPQKLKPKPADKPLNSSTTISYKSIFKIAAIIVGLTIIVGYFLLNFVETLNLTNQEQRPYHKLILPAFITIIIAIVARMKTRKMGYTILQIAAFSIFSGGLVDLVFTYVSPSLPSAHVNYLQAEAVSNNLVRLDFALIRSLGTSLMAVGLGVWMLLAGPIKQGNKTAMIGLVAMVTMAEGNNSIQMYSINLDFYIYTITIVGITWIGACLWWQGEQSN
ncbi:hypothetical protein BH10BAC4_BH10BAC4_17450 [soil metagenome]